MRNEYDGSWMQFTNERRTSKNQRHVQSTITVRATKTPTEAQWPRCETRSRSDRTSTATSQCSYCRRSSLFSLSTGSTFPLSMRALRSRSRGHNAQRNRTTALCAVGNAECTARALSVSGIAVVVNGAAGLQQEPS